MAIVDENLPSATRERPVGFGRLKRKEDARFIRGKGTYLDDIRLPGMLHGAILRSPYAHARINSIDTSKALEHPNVAAVVTARTSRPSGSPGCLRSPTTPRRCWRATRSASKARRLHS